MEAATIARPQPSTERKPSGRQVYFACRLALEALGIDWPESRADASAVIERLTGVKREAEADIPL